MRTTVLDTYWNQFREQAFKEREDEHDYDYERRLWFAGVVAVVAHVAHAKDPDAMFGRLGEIVREVDAVQKHETAAREAAANKPDQEVCYDGT
jgi:hypothetical protein